LNDDEAESRKLEQAASLEQGTLCLEPKVEDEKSAQPVNYANIKLTPALVRDMRNILIAANVKNPDEIVEKFIKMKNLKY
jgi:hypothetical protein